MKIATTRRAGVTLIEILVVIAIIGILASLMLGGVMMFMRKGPETVTKHDIGQMSVALGRFYADYKFYPPSKIRLCSNRSQYNPSATPPTAQSLLDASSLKTISSIWPSINFTNVRWDGSAGTNALDFTLEGDQCLVFFLNGLTIDPKDPMNAAAEKKKFFQFDVGRLKPRNPASPAFPSYVDAYGQMPFVYFSSGGIADRYDSNHAIAGLGVAPYASTLGPPAKYHNSTTFQIVSAGLDRQFGPGGLWAAASANTIPMPGKDDMSNFHDKFLGIP